MLAIEAIVKQGDRTQAQRLIRKKLQAEPDSHWLWAILSSTYYEQREYEKALEYSQKALSLAPRCPLVLWHYAGALDQLGLTKEALAIWKKLLRRNLTSIAYGECGEGIVSARSLLNDCNYRIAKCYAWIEQNGLAERYFRKYLDNRRKGARSIYDVRAVKKKLAQVDRCK